MKLDTGQIRKIAEDCGIQVEYETDTRFMVYCPFHINHKDPAATIDKNNGYFYCFNAACGARKDIETWVRELKKISIFPAKRLISSFQNNQPLKLELDFEGEEDKFLSFPKELFDEAHIELMASDLAKDYLLSDQRNFQTLETAKYFNLGFFEEEVIDGKHYTPRIVIPMQDISGNYIGYLCRNIGARGFKNSPKLPSSKTLFNIHNAIRKSTDFVIIVESAFDAMRVHEAGYPNVVATMGGTFSDRHLWQLGRFFDKIVIATDGDEPGEAFARKIADRTKSKMLAYRICYYLDDPFPPGIKDISEIKDNNQIKELIKNRNIITR